MNKVRVTFTEYLIKLPTNSSTPFLCSLWMFCLDGIFYVSPTIK